MPSHMVYRASASPTSMHCAPSSVCSTVEAKTSNHSSPDRRIASALPGRADPRRAPHILYVRTNPAPAARRNATLPPKFVSERKQDGGVGSVNRSSAVQIRGDVKMRLAFENNFLDLVIAAVQRAGDTRVEGRAIGKAADRLQDCGAHQFAAFRDAHPESKSSRLFPRAAADARSPRAPIAPAASCGYRETGPCAARKSRSFLLRASRHRGQQEQRAKAS